MEEPRPGFWQRLKAGFRLPGGEDAAGERAAGGPFRAPVYPAGVDTAHVHRRQAWTIRVLGITTGFLALSTVSLAMTIATLVPLKRVDLALLQVAGSGEQVVEVKPLRTEIPVMDVMTRAWVQEYVLMRNTVVPDQALMDQRIKYVRERSAQPVFLEYAERNRTFVPEAVSKRLSRNIQIRAVTRDKARNAIWFVDFVTTDTYPEREPQSRSFRAQLVVEYRPRLTTAGELDGRDLVNPFGFTVQRYDVSGMADNP